MRSLPNRRVPRGGHALFALAVTTTLAVTAASASAQSALKADASTRARLDLEAGVGAAFGDTRGGAFGLTGQLGLQANDLFAIYWQPGLMVDGWAAEGDDVDVFVFGSQLAMMDFTFGRAFQIGAGAGVDIGRFGLCTGPREDPECEYQSRQVRAATEARMAFIIPLPGLRARWGIPIALHFHTTYFPGQQIHTLLATTGLLRF
ncbi:MAG: hypothetical protein ACOC97_01285 [Myxococcota bacterium]